MSTHDNSGPAFPDPALANPQFRPTVDLTGLTIRDYMAAKAMAALIVRGHPFGTPEDRDLTVFGAYALADAMLVERAK